jgi:hypothetical protein
MNNTTIDRSKTALVVIDLQKGIVGRQTAPHAADEVVRNAAALAEACRKNGMPVFLVRVTPSPDGKDALRPIADLLMQAHSPVIGKNSVSRCGAGEGRVILSGSRQASNGFQPRELTTSLAGAPWVEWLHRRRNGLLNGPVRRVILSGRQPFVAMMDPAHFVKRDDLSFCRSLHRARLRGIFVQSQMRPAPVII